MGSESDSLFVEDTPAGKVAQQLEQSKEAVFTAL
jgi:hypothetical protein